MSLRIDFHKRFTLESFLRILPEIDSLHPVWIEEPCELGEGYREIRETTIVPLAAGELYFGRDKFVEIADNGWADVVMPDVKHAGGLLEIKRIAGAARMHALLVAPHNPSGPVAAAASAQLVSTLTNFLILEYAWGEVPWRADLLDPAERIEGGYLQLAEGPGLGHRLNPDLVAAHRIAA